ncbi:MAG: hypothetical protein WAW02_04675 [Sideroxyarcus sp.]
MDSFKSNGVAGFLSGMLVLVLIGCGGGAEKNTSAPASVIISGTVAAGAPVVGYVSVRDSSSNPQPVRTGIPIAADGKYSVEVAGLTAPYAFLADGTVGGRRVQLYSAATKADENGNISITPFTDLMLRNIAGTIATTLTDAISSKLPNLTTAELNAQRDQLTAQLAPVLVAAGLPTSIDLLRSAFNADNTGLDRFMDLVKVDTTVPTAVTITNILDANNKLTVNPQTGVTSGGTSLSATGVTPATQPNAVDLIMQVVNSFSAFFATSLPSPTDPTLVAMFSSTFVDNGRTRDAFLTQITNSSVTLGLKFSNLVVDSVDTNTGIATIHYVPENGAGANLSNNDKPGGAESTELKYEGGAWKIHGNQRIANVHIQTMAERWTCIPASINGCSPGTSYKTGFNLLIDNPAMAAIGSAVVTGPGLGAGVTLVAQANQTGFVILNPPACSGCVTNSFYMDDAAITGMGSGPYTYQVALYDNATTPALIATSTEVVPVAPTLNSALATFAFPSNTSAVNLANVAAGGTLTVNWTIPAGLSGDLVGVSVNNSTDNVRVTADLIGKTATSGSSILNIRAPNSGAWTGGNVSISTWDVNLGKVNSYYQ